ncbi:MAG: ATP-binding protein [Ignavibacteria bacterium]|nr:ATP-binding protein [Ignavibacteria bacterium]
MEDLSLHILDIAENSVNAGAKNIEITIKTDKENDLLILEIIDDGQGMEKEFAANAADPFQTKRTTRKVGLGLAFLDEATKQTEGKLTVDSSKGIGTKIRATFKLSHIDTKPVGDIAETLVMLIAGNPEIDIRYNHFLYGSKFIFDTKDIRESYPTLQINSVNVLGFIRKFIRENINIKK